MHSSLDNSVTALGPSWFSKIQTSLCSRADFSLRETSFLTNLPIWATTCDFQQFGILTNVHSGEPVQPHFKLRIPKWCSVSSIRVIEYSSDQQRLRSDCAYAQAGLRLCRSHIPHCWKSHVAAHLVFILVIHSASHKPGTSRPVPFHTQQ